MSRPSFAGTARERHRPPTEQHHRYPSPRANRQLKASPSELEQPCERWFLKEPQHLAPRCPALLWFEFPQYALAVIIMERLGFLHRCQDIAGVFRVVSMAIQLSDQFFLSRKPFFTFGYMAFGESEMLQDRLAVHVSSIHLFPTCPPPPDATILRSWMQTLERY